MFRIDLRRNEFKSEIHNQRDNDQIVQMTNDRDEVRNNVDGGEGVSERRPKEHTGKPRGTQISVDSSIECDIPFKT